MIRLFLHFNFLWNWCFVYGDTDWGFLRNKPLRKIQRILHLWLWPNFIGPVDLISLFRAYFSLSHLYSTPGEVEKSHTGFILFSFFTDYASWLIPVLKNSNQLGIFKVVRRIFDIVQNLSLVPYEVSSWYILDPFQNGWHGCNPWLLGQLTRFLFFRIQLSLSHQKIASPRRGRFLYARVIFGFFIFQIKLTDLTQFPNIAVSWVRHVYF